ncbi:MAG: hypothetical protein QM680_10745 [Luteolibacter sp.]
MRFFLLALMLLGLLTGGSVRAAECTDNIPATDCCQSHGDHKGHPEDQCPEGHHHHQACCHTAPSFFAEENHELSLPLTGYRELSFRPQSDRVPEGPFLNSEKPPLI